MFSFLIWDNQVSLNEIFYDMVGLALKPGAKENVDMLVKEYETHAALFRIYTRMDELKYETIDWERGIKDGIFSLVNYYQIPELKKFREQGKKNFLDDKTHLEYRNKIIKDLEEKYKE